MCEINRDTAMHPHIGRHNSTVLASTNVVGGWLLSLLSAWARELTFYRINIIIIIIIIIIIFQYRFCRRIPRSTNKQADNVQMERKGR